MQFFFYQDWFFFNWSNGYTTLFFIRFVYYSPTIIPINVICLLITRELQKCLKLRIITEFWRPSQKSHWLKPLKLSYIHSHFSCINFGPRGELNHLPLSEKKPDYKPLVKELVRRKVSITMISESPLLEKDALKVKKMFQEAGYRF